MGVTPQFEAALTKLQKQAGQGGAPYGARVNAENEYGIAYQQMVRKGLAPQIRGKYRG